MVYDVDDLIFDPDGDDHLQGLAASPSQTPRMSESFRSAMMLCDAVSVSTSYLKQRVDCFHPACTVMPNGISRKLQMLGANHRKSGKPGR